MSSTSDSERSSMRARARSTGETVRYVLAAILALALLVFALVNTDESNVDYVVGDSDAPLIVIMLISAAAGALIAFLLGRRRR
jgi:uncharacterized integral membrane protein